MVLVVVVDVGSLAVAIAPAGKVKIRNNIDRKNNADVDVVWTDPPKTTVTKTNWTYR